MIEVHDLCKRFWQADHRERVAVDHVSFVVRPGEVYGLLGPNGAGKTTTIRMVLGLLRPTSGWASIAGYHSTDYPEEVKRRVGLVAAGTGLYQWLSVREFLLFFADLYDVPPAEARLELEHLTQLLRIRNILSQRCATLSTGEKQRVNLARALIHRPPVMLLDEPTLGLDVLGSQVVIEYIAHLRTEGKAVIITTHRLDEAERLCDRFGLLHLGKLVREGTLAELREATGCTGLVDMFLKLSDVGPMLAPARQEASP